MTDKLFQVLKGIGLGTVFLFFIVAGRYMNKVAVVEEKCNINAAHIETNTKAVSISIRKSNDALKSSKEAIKSNKEVATIVEDIKSSLNKINISTAVTTDRLRRNSEDLKEIKRLVKTLSRR